ncbi:MAG TPA: hypothetical protein VHT04_15380 [Stellaceae bacterium]|nr:hypothetical protein [Stellaceae bacterium]
MTPITPPPRPGETPPLCLPRRLGDDLRMNWQLVPGDRAALAAMAERLRAAL